VAHGGKREGAGRTAKPPEERKKTGRKTNEERRERAKTQNNQTFDERAIEALPELFDTIKAIATGYKIAAYTAPRKAGVKATPMVDAANEPIWVYSTPPDKTATQYLIDRAAGRAAVKNPDVAETELILEVSISDEDDVETTELESAEGGSEMVPSLQEVEDAW
jgi:hypothetical protein